MKILKKSIIAFAILIGILLIILIAALLFLRFYPSVGEMPDKEAKAEFEERTALFYDGTFHNENDYTVMTGMPQNQSDRRYPKEMIPVIKNADIQRGIGGVTYTLVPAQHNSGRNPLKSNTTLWGGIYMNDGDHAVYYTGDTGYYDVFSRIYDTCGEIDLMMADSGQYDSAWATTHMTPAESVQAAKDAQAKWYIPIHWGAFVLSNHAWDEPPILAVEAAEKLEVNIATPKIGERVDFSQMDQYNEHWWEGIE